MKCALLGERHQGLRDGVGGLLGTSFGAVFMVADEVSLVEGAARLQPLLMVVDLALARGDLPCLLERLRRLAPTARILLLSVHDEDAVAADAFAAGADGLLLKREVATELPAAVDAVLAGKRYVSRGATS